jgi:hypothetical protein
MGFRCPLPSARAPPGTDFNEASTDGAQNDTHAKKSVDPDHRRSS